MVPVPVRALERFGRASVLALRTGNRRQVFAPTLSAHASVGHASAGDAEIGAAIASWTPTATSVARLDWHLRRELAARVLEQAVNATSAELADDGTAVLAWRRPGPAETEDADHSWWSASASASVEVGVPVSCLVIVTRWGWWSLPEGPSRRWARLRQHASAVSGGQASSS